MSAPAIAPPRPARTDAVLPAWPVLLLLWGFPLWWAIGLLPFAQAILALPMLAMLILHRRVVLVPGLLPFLTFAIWVIPSALMIDDKGHLIHLGVRFSWYFSLAILMLYIVNSRESLTPRRVFNSLTFVWFFVIAGGYLGMMFPDVRLTATVGQLLPGAIAHNDYVSDLVFPPLAEIQTPWGAGEEGAFVRPSAPFSYSNGWGAAMAVLTPVAIGAAVGHRTARAMWLLAAGGIAAVPPAIATTNRGLFLGLAGATAYVLLRLLLRGRWLALLGVALVSGATAVSLYLFGVVDGITARQDAVDTTLGRSEIYRETFERTLGSPVLGYGAPRPSSWSEIYVGTQGSLWQVMFCFGFVGLALFATAMIGGAARTADAPNLSALWMHTGVVVACGLAAFYGLDRHLLFVGVVLAVLLREKHRGGSRYWTPLPSPFALAGNAR